MIDPICGMEVEPSTAAASHVHNGQTYFFCSHHCLAKFKEDPEKFRKSPASGHAHEHAAAHSHRLDKAEQGTYVCPMDPEVREVETRSMPQVRHGFGTRGPVRSSRKDRVRLSHASGDRPA